MGLGIPTSHSQPSFPCVQGRSAVDRNCPTVTRMKVQKGRWTSSWAARVLDITGRDFRWFKVRHRRILLTGSKKYTL